MKLPWVSMDLSAKAQGLQRNKLDLTTQRKSNEHFATEMSWDYLYMFSMSSSLPST